MEERRLQFLIVDEPSPAAFDGLISALIERAQEGVPKALHLRPEGSSPKKCVDGGVRS
jgi:hypothetical protein